MSAKVEAFLQFLKAARSLADQGMSKEAIMQFAENQFGKISKDGLFYKQIQNIFKPKEGIEKIKIKDEVFDDTVVKLPIDDTGQPFNPKDPLKQYGKPKKLTYEEAIAQEEAKAAADEDYIMKIFDPEDFATGGRAGYYTGGMIDVEPNLSDIGHGSDSLMARTRLVSPNSQATTSTGLNYLLAEDNDNIRVPFSKGKLALTKLNEGRRKFMKTAAAGAAGLAALKTGLIGLGKEAAPIAEKVVETAKGVPPYFFQLMDVIKSKGQEIKSYGERIKQTIAPSKDGKSELMLTEDLNTGDIQIKKIYKEGDDMVTKSEEMNFNKGRADEGTKGTPADSYEEVTEYNSRIYKDRFNEPDVVDGIDVEEIIKEVDVKKASGGIARMIGE